MLSEIALRCNSCGAPYDRPGAQELLTCSYCGTTQRIVDARAFLDHFTAQITAFLHQALPPGISLNGAGAVDPVARSVAFSSSVRPRLVVEGDQYRFSLFSLLSHPFPIIPFFRGSGPPSTAPAATVSIFAEKVRSVSALAVDDPSKELIRRFSAVAVGYQSLLVASGLLHSKHPERYHLLRQNLQTAADALAPVATWTLVAKRLSALSELSHAADEILSGKNVESAKEALSKAGTGLAAARAGLSAVPELGFMAAPVDQELAAVRSASLMFQVLRESGAVSPPPLVFLQNHGEMLNWLGDVVPPAWSTAYRSIRLREELLLAAVGLRKALAGTGNVRWAAQGPGPLLPFWAVELPYTFETGVLWRKKGVEVPELLLVAATFPSDLRSFSLGHAPSVLTDVFSAGPPNTGATGYVDRLAGNQSRLSEGGWVAALVRSSGEGPAPGRVGVPPLASRMEAQQIVQLYLQHLSSRNATLSNQLRAASPRVKELIYLPGSLSGGPTIPSLGPMAPRSIGDPEVLRRFIGG